MDVVEDDHALAMYLQNLYNEEDEAERNASQPEPPPPPKDITLVDEYWELYDPNPDVHQLFVQFDHDYFRNKLRSVALKWSSRMTSCAGLCRYKFGGECIISLSQPLLKLRPRKDLVETLLHEMIHAYLFVTHNYKDHDDHGNEFHKHMNRINRLSGTNITVYHNFHDEVESYQQHWWRCTGICKNQPPFYGLVKRSINRAPGPNDSWWVGHNQWCRGSFIKIKEPANYKPRGNIFSLNNSLRDKADSQQSDIRRHLAKPSRDRSPSYESNYESNYESDHSTREPQTFLSNTKKSKFTSYTYETPYKKIKVQNSPGKVKIHFYSENSTFIDMNSFQRKPRLEPSSSQSTSFSPFSGTGNVLGSSSTNPTNKRKKSIATPKKKKSSNNMKIDEMFSKQSSASGAAASTQISEVLDILDSESESESSVVPSCSSSQTVACPVCCVQLPETTINQHLDTCLTY